MDVGIQLERTDCGAYCKPDERFWVERVYDIDGGRVRALRQWTITDTANIDPSLKHTFVRVRTLREAEAAINAVLS